MTLEEYRILFLVITLGLASIASSPLIAMSFNSQDDPEHFSELFLLNEDHLAMNYPSDVNTAEQYSVFVNLINHLGSSEFYKLQIKLRIFDQAANEVGISQPSSSRSVYNYLFVVEDENGWGSQVNFGFQEVTIQNNEVNIGNFVLNNLVLPVDLSTPWNTENDGYIFQLFFELYRYNEYSHQFVYDNQFVGLWLNMTVSE